ncbi:hypothetical protein K440DRAFT_622050 [Wilcoxina mikolae CBS 423.85]|nr:hypothetical protein K440DRAFT_622050 [Wilcoxina mikolae CBS 423.85]
MARKPAKTKEKNVKINERNRRLLSPAESEDDSTTCDAILVARSDLGEEDTMKADAKDAFEQALYEDELHVEVGVTGEMVVGNRRGLNLATRLCALEYKVASQDSEIASLKEDIKIVSLEDRVSSLTSSLDAYKLLRNQFISTFKRDKLRNATEADRKIIAEGNGWAHGGDAVVDAQLYQGMGGRRDTKAFEELYGMSPGEVQMIANH